MTNVVPDEQLHIPNKSAKEWYTQLARALQDANVEKPYDVADAISTHLEVNVRQPFLAIERWVQRRTEATATGFVVISADGAGDYIDFNAAGNNVSNKVVLLLSGTYLEQTSPAETVTVIAAADAIVQMDVVDSALFIFGGNWLFDELDGAVYQMGGSVGITGSSVDAFYTGGELAAFDCNMDALAQFILQGARLAAPGINLNVRGKTYTFLNANGEIPIGSAPTGTAGGALYGNYPDPEIAADFTQEFLV